MATHPLTALQDLRGYSAKYQWSRWRVLRQLLDRRSYRAWLGRVARDLNAPPRPGGRTAPRLRKG
ncbi:hypothetical protein [Streptomyces sp. NPDC056387]|uniref:hypothetical protein n=1 Tax=Streptomyces sp. NPDC056387 TaxID=3345803 RepID=UPI0035D61880